MPRGRKALRYAGPLAKLAFGRNPLETRGRKKVQLPASFPLDLVVVNHKNPQVYSRRAVARALSKQSKYRGIHKRVIERGVDAEIALWVALLKKCPPRRWSEVFKIDPPAKMTPQALRKKAFELMRLQFGPKLFSDK